MWRLGSRFGMSGAPLDRLRLVTFLASTALFFAEPEVRVQRPADCRERDEGAAVEADAGGRVGRERNQAAGIDVERALIDDGAAGAAVPIPTFPLGLT